MTTLRLLLATTLAAQALAADGLQLAVSPEVLEPGQPLHLIADNPSDTPADLALTWTLQTNPSCIDTPSPDPIFGRDIARGATSSVTVDGTDRGDALVCDADDGTAYETPWGKVRDVIATIDLGAVRDITGLKWRAGNPDWIWQADIATATDGKNFQAAPAKLDLHGKSGGYVGPWTTTKARFIRLHFHQGTDQVDHLVLPATIEVFSQPEDPIPVPTVGVQICAGTTTASIPAKSHADLTLKTPAPLGPGAYLLGLTPKNPGKPTNYWQSIFVRPTDPVDPARATRFGVNGADIALAPELRRCGFGWVRFENCKWAMFSSAPDAYAFDGTVAPWYVNDDAIFADYRKNGLNILPYVFQTPEWATTAPAGKDRNRFGYPPRNPADYGEAIYQLVARYGHAPAAPATLKTTDHKTALGLLDVVELWNEPNLNDPGWGPFVGPLVDYFAVMRAGVDGAHRADPHLLISAGGLAGLDLATVGALATFHYTDGKTPLDLVDIVNVHFYSGRDQPELCGRDPNAVRADTAHPGLTYPEQLAGLVAWRDHNKPGAKIWLSETGNDVGGPIGRSERQQAAKVPRAVMLALASGIDKVFIYREKGSNPSMHAGAGLLRNDLSVRPMYLTVATMIRQLQGFSGTALRLPNPDPRVWIYLWQDGPRRLITAWTTSGTAPCPTGLGPATISDAFGHPAPAITLLSEFPTYITLKTTTPALEKLIAAAKATAP